MSFFIPKGTRKYFNQGYHCTVGVTKGSSVKQPKFDEFEGNLLSIRELTKEQLDLATNPFPVNEKTFHLYICTKDPVNVGKRFALSIQLVKKD